MVKISADKELSEAMDKVAALLDNNLEAFRVGSNSWAQQFAEAVEMPSAEEFGEGGPGCLDYFTHFATFYWKVLFAFVPPTSYCNGWLTFWMSIVFIGILTGIVGDIAGVFGCLLARFFAIFLESGFDFFLQTRGARLRCVTTPGCRRIRVAAHTAFFRVTAGAR